MSNYIDEVAKALEEKEMIEDMKDDIYDINETLKSIEEHANHLAKALGIKGLDLYTN